MQLPAEFPHTRREQYVVVLPLALMTESEMDTCAQVIRRLEAWLALRKLRLLVGLRADGWSMEEIFGLLGLPPAAFCLPEPDE